MGGYIQGIPTTKQDKGNEMQLREAKQQITNEVSRINGFLTIWEPEMESVLAVKLGVKTATEAAQSELDHYTRVCTKAFNAKQI